MNITVGKLYVGRKDDLTYHTNTPTPNIRFMTWEALRSYLNDNNRFSDIQVNVDDESDYHLSPTMTYLDTEIDVNSDGFSYAERCGYAILRRNPAIAFPNFGFGYEKAGNDACVNCFLVFITHVEFNQLTNKVRYYYTVDWWDTLLMWNQRPTVYGVCERAHVDDLSPDFKVISDYFTDEVEFQLPQKDVVCMSTPIVKRPDIDEGVLDDGLLDPERSFATIYYLYITLANTSAIPNLSPRVNASANRIVHDGMQLSVLNPSITLCTLVDVNSGRLLSQRGSSSTFLYLRDLVADSIISMNLSLVPPEPSSGFRKDDYGHIYLTGVVPSFVDLCVSGNKDDAVDKRIECVISVDQRCYFDIDALKERLFSDNRVPYKQSLYFEKSPVQYVIGSFESYLNNCIVKSHMYPYCYYSIYRGRTEVTFVSEWMTDDMVKNIKLYRDYTTDAFMLTFESENSYGKETVYTFEYPSLFAAPFKQSWLERTTSLESGAFQIAGSAVGIVSSAAAAIIGASTLNPFAIAGGAVGIETSAVSLAQKSIAFDRERKATEAGYFVRGSMPIQAFSSLSGEALIYLKYTAYTETFARQLNLNLHYFGYNTLVDAGDIVNTTAHRRESFNYVKTVSCNVISGSLPLDIKSDIKDMFDRGVWLFSDDYLTFDRPNPPDYSVR